MESPEQDQQNLHPPALVRATLREMLQPTHSPTFCLTFLPIAINFRPPEGYVYHPLNELGLV